MTLYAGGRREKRQTRCLRQIAVRRLCASSPLEVPSYIFGVAPAKIVQKSYYLNRTAGWKYCKKGPADVNIKTDSFDQSADWYENGKDRLLICAVGGKDRFKAFFKSKIERPIIDSGAFSRLALVLDRDDKEVKSIESHAASILKPVVTKMRNNEWVSNVYEDAYSMEQKIETLLVAVPKEHQGALETLMMDSIAEDPYDAIIVEKSGVFVKEMKAFASKYIDGRRKEIKAHLGVTWAIQYPEKVFKLMNEQIQSVKWEKSGVLRDCFGMLIRI